MKEYIVQGDEMGMYGTVKANSPKEAVIKFESAWIGRPQKEIRKHMRNVKGVKDRGSIYFPGYWVTEKKPNTNMMHAVNMQL